MINQLLKMLWKQRRRHFGIFIEQLLVAVVLMLATVSVAEMVEKYATPGLLDADNTISIAAMYAKDVSEEEKAKVQEILEVIAAKLRKLPCVEAIAATENLMPYGDNDEQYYRMSDSIHVDDRHFLAVRKYSDEFGAAVLKPKMEEGAWLENRALPDGSAPVVITRQLADKAGWTTAIGKKLTVKGRTCTVVGVAAGLKQMTFSPSPVAVVLPRYAENREFQFYVVRIKAGMQQEFIDAFSGEFQRLIPDERINPRMFTSQDMKAVGVFSSIFGVVLQSIPTAFLFLFAFIGTFGLSWMTSRRRLKEFALRIALGSAKGQLMYIVIGESLLVTAIAVVPALLLSFFIYEYTAVHVIGVGVTILTMLLFSAISAWYPAWKVSRVNPAEALQYE